MSKLTEFQLIDYYFKRNEVKRPEILCGIGDDAAIIGTLPNQQLAIAIDTLVAGVHFPHSTSAYNIGYKSLAVNLSDLAAMGAEPAWATLALTLPTADDDWLKQFTAGFFDLASQYHLSLIGGDTTRGPLTVTVQVAGYVLSPNILYRSGAKVGDLIYVTGPLGDAALAFTLNKTAEHSNDPDTQYLQERFNRPQPRVKEGLLLREFAHAAIDISDGLLADLRHILDGSKVGAKIYLEKIPLSPVFIKYQKSVDWQSLALTFGDDYELCFTAAPSDQMRIASELPQAICIGEIISQPDLLLLDERGSVVKLPQLGYEHFTGEAKS